MPIIRATFFFKDAVGSGWTETIHNTGADLTTVRSAALRLVPLRVALMGSTSSLEKVRISDDLVFRDSSLYYVPTGNQMNKSALDGSDFSDNCVLTNLRATATSRRSLYMRGYPDGISMNSGQFSPTPQWSAAFINWQTELLASNWAIKSRDKLIIPDPITAAVQALPSGIVTVTTLNPHGFNAGDGINISGVRPPASALNGNYTVLSVAGLTFSVALNSIMNTFVGGGRAIKYGYLLWPITSATAERIAERKAGAPFDLRRGRRRVKRLLL
jgi:hypothetical protein